MAPKIAIVYYSMYGHIGQLAQAELKGIQAAGGTADLFQIEETLPQDVLDKMHAPAKAANIQVLSDPSKLLEYDAFLFGIPTRFGNFPAQWKAFWDKTGGIWFSGGFSGKFAGLFVSTGISGGGQEVTALSSISTLTHHGIIFVPLGTTYSQFVNIEEVHGGSPWGAGTFAGPDGSRQPSKRELDIATAQGEAFFKTVAKSTGRSGNANSSVSTTPKAQQEKPEVKAAAVADSATPQESKKSSAGPCGLPSKCTIT